METTTTRPRPLTDSQALRRARKARQARATRRLGAIAMERGLVTKDELRKTLRQQRALRKRERFEARLGELFVAGKLLTADQVRELLGAQGNRPTAQQIADRVRELRRCLRDARKRRKSREKAELHAQRRQTREVVPSVQPQDAPEQSEPEIPVGQELELAPYEIDPFDEPTHEFLAWLQTSDPKAYALIQSITQAD